MIVFFFFFQAEDGIRDSSVTGVQTCALPISPLRRQWPLRSPFVSFCYFEPKQSPSEISAFSVAGPAPHHNSGIKAPAPLASLVSFSYFVSPAFEPRQSGSQNVTKSTKRLPPSHFES